MSGGDIRELLERRLSLCAGIVLAGLSASGSWAQDGLALELLPAWNGITRPGAITEVGVRLRSPESRVIAIEIGAEPVAVGATVTVLAEQPRTVWIPYRASARAPLVLSAYSEGRLLARLEKWLFQPAPAERVVAVVVGGAPTVARDALSWPRTHVLTVAASSLPRTVQAYGVVAATVLDGRALTALDGAQLDALGATLARCGRVVVTGISAALRAELEHIAGCGGAFLKTTPSFDQVAESVAALLRERPPELPGKRDLLAIMAPAGGAGSYSLVLAFLGFYAAALGAAALLARRPWVLLVAPIAATALALLAWRSGLPWDGLMTWSEVAQDEVAGRYAALLRVDGRGRGQTRVSIPASGIVAAPLPEGAVLRLAMDDQGGTTAAIEIETHLFSRHDIYFQGTFRGRPPFSIALRDGRPLVTNLGPEATPSAILARRGVRYALPSLAPKEEWAMPDAPLRADLDPVEKLLQQRLRGDRPALLVPYVPQSARMMTMVSPPQGWLVLHGDAKSGGGSP